MEKSALAGEGGGLHAHPHIYHHVEVVVYAPDERADTLPLFHLYPYMYSVGSRTICTRVCTPQTNTGIHKEGASLRAEHMFREFTEKVKYSRHLSVFYENVR
jgi:hypothetical protein